MITSKANVEMNDPLRAMRRLCRHWSHKLTVDFNDEEGNVTFETGSVHFTILPESLSMHLTAETEEDLTTLQDVIDRHLIRMVSNEELTITWV